MLSRYFLVMVLLVSALAWNTGFAAQIWYEDNNMAKPAGLPDDFQEKFARPEAWAGARKHIDTYMFRANIFGNKAGQVDDALLKNQIIPVLKQSGIKIALDVGGATWRGFGNRDDLLNEELRLVERIGKLGGEVSYISMQSILSKKLFDKGEEVPYPMEQRVADAVDYAKAVKGRFPNIRIGIIDALPSHGKDYQSAYVALAKAFKANGLSLDHVILDLPYELVKERKAGMSWQKLLQVERFVKRDIGAKFGLIATSRKAGYQSDRDFHQAVMAMQENYAKAGGDPDFYLLASWFPHPSATIPDTAKGGDFPAMRTVLEFATAQPAAEQPAAEQPRAKEGESPFDLLRKYVK
jgi:hypothetical protein